MTLDDQAEALRLQLELAAADYPVGVAWRAASDHFAAIIGFAAESRAHADELCQAAARDMHRAILRNWDDLQRAAAAPTGRA